LDGSLIVPLIPVNRKTTQVQNDDKRKESNPSSRCHGFLSELQHAFINKTKMQHPADAVQERSIIKDALQVSILATRNMSRRESKVIIEKISVHAQL